MKHLAVIINPFKTFLILSLFYLENHQLRPPPPCLPTILQTHNKLSFKLQVSTLRTGIRRNLYIRQEEIWTRSRARRRRRKMLLARAAEIKMQLIWRFISLLTFYYDKNDFFCWRNLQRFLNNCLGHLFLLKEIISCGARTHTLHKKIYN